MVKMIQNMHTHGVFCDGRDTPEDMVKRALELGFTSLGFSSHANTRFSDTCEMGDRVAAYRAEITRLKKEYDGRLDIFLGTELDYYTPGYMDTDGYDYKIASVHYAIKDGEKICYDISIAHSEDVIKRLCGGDGLEYARLYYENMAKMPGVLDGDFVGHFDILTKYEQRAPHLFDTASAKYRKMALEALDAVREKFEFFEINTGTIARGYKDVPYPAPFILDRMRELDCKLLITTDCHDKRFLDCGFGDAVEIARAHGFTEIYNFTKNGFEGAKI